MVGAQRQILSGVECRHQRSGSTDSQGSMAGGWLAEHVIAGSNWNIPGTLWVQLWVTNMVFGCGPVGTGERRECSRDTDTIIKAASHN